MPRNEWNRTLDVVGLDEERFSVVVVEPGVSDE